MYGNTLGGESANETTLMRPVSPYGVAKLFAFNMTRAYRERGMFACNGILFNHSSPRRGRAFVEAKVVDGAIKRRFLNGLPLELGNLDAVRDWGHSREYVQAMRLMLRHSEPDDYVVGTGVVWSVCQLAQMVFSGIGLPWTKENVSHAERLERPVELN
jgi:GDPmannose 4,6-dehydratase